MDTIKFHILLKTQNKKGTQTPTAKTASCMKQVESQEESSFKPDFSKLVCEF